MKQMNIRQAKLVETFQYRVGNDRLKNNTLEFYGWTVCEIRSSYLWWHISAITCQIIMLTCQIFMLTCQIFMLTCHLFPP